MVSFDTTATCAEDAFMQSANPTESRGTAIFVAVQSYSAGDTRAIIGFRVPSKPIGTDRLTKVQLVLTHRGYVANAASRSYLAYDLRGRLWTSTIPGGEYVDWTYYDSGLAWTTPGGDLNNQVARSQVTDTTDSSYAWDFSLDAYGLDWNKRGSVIIIDANEGDATQRLKGFYSLESSVATAAWKPHIVVSAEDDPPAGIKDLTASADTSLSEATYTFRQRERK